MASPPKPTRQSNPTEAKCEFAPDSQIIAPFNTLSVNSFGGVNLQTKLSLNPTQK